MGESILEQIILFDGDCNFCNGSVQFILKRDPQGLFKFASLQSDIGLQLKEQYGISPTEDSFILIKDERYLSKSTAALHVAKQLTGGWPLFYSLIIVPRPIRDFFYHTFSKIDINGSAKANNVFFLLQRFVIDFCKCCMM